MAQVLDDPILDDPVLEAFVAEHSAASLLARLQAMSPSSFVLDALMTIDRTRLDPTCAVTFLQVLQRVQARLHAVELEALVAAASSHPVVEELQVRDPHPENATMRTIRIQDACREEIASALRLSAQAASSGIDRARLLAGPLPATRASLLAGRVTRAHVAALVESARRLPGAMAVLSGDGTDEVDDRVRAERRQFADACRELERRVLPVAERSTVAATRRAARRAVLAIDAAGEARRRARAAATRDVFVVDDEDGHSTLIARMTTEHPHACLFAIRARADAPDLDVPASASAGERRSAALLALITEDADSRQAWVQARVDLVIDLPTLLSLRNGVAGGTGAVDILGAGPVSAEALRDLVSGPDADVTVRRLVVEPLSGHLLDVGRSRYQVTSRLREFLVVRDRTCRFPGCGRAAARGQMDHAQAWDDGGETSRANLGALCVRHHQLKTFAGWQIHGSAENGACSWRSPQGRRYDHDPPPC